MRVSAKFCFACVLTAAALLVAVPPAWGQGCVAARQGTAMIGALCPYASHSNAGDDDSDSGPRAIGPGIPDAPHRTPWTISFGYRYQPSSRHFRGDVEQTERDAANSEITNIYHLLDFSISRQISRRWSLTASVPLLFAYRDQKYAPSSQQHVRSIGDMTLGAKVWLFKPPTETGGNVSIGFNIKLPTGEYNATGLATDRQGNPVVATVDQSVMAGDGGTGFSLDFQAFKPIPWESMVYLSGTYLFNPRETNGVSTFRTRPGEEVMSVTDQYLFRGGVSRPILKLRGFVATFGARWEGVPAKDAFGGSEGFRRPGYAVSLDPGLMYSRGNSIYSINIPFAVHRDRTRSVSDISNGIHGDAAFADYAIIFGFSRYF
jgi:hypothetical protein